MLNRYADRSHEGREVFGLFGGRDRWLSAGERARLVHERWLSWALGSDGPRRTLPVIPLRAVRDGGFGGLMRTAEGRAWAEAWWESALARVDDEE